MSFLRSITKCARKSLNYETRNAVSSVYARCTYVSVRKREWVREYTKRTRRISSRGVNNGFFQRPRPFRPRNSSTASERNSPVPTQPSESANNAAQLSGVPRRSQASSSEEAEQAAATSARDPGQTNVSHPVHKFIASIETKINNNKKKRCGRAGAAATTAMKANNRRKRGVSEKGTRGGIKKETGVSPPQSAANENLRAPAVHSSGRAAPDSHPAHTPDEGGRAGRDPHTDGGGGGDAKINKEETKRPGNQTNTSEPGLVAVMPRR